MDVSITIAVIALISAFVSSYFTYRSSIKATSIEAQKVDQQAYDRAVTFYQRQLDDATKQIDRVTAQLDRLNIQLEKVSSQLATEKDASTALRGQVRNLELQISLLTGTISELREKLAEKSGPK